MKERSSWLEQLDQVEIAHEHRKRDPIHTQELKLFKEGAQNYEPSHILCRKWASIFGDFKGTGIADNGHKHIKDGLS